MSAHLDPFSFQGPIAGLRLHANIVFPHAHWLCSLILLFQAS